MTTGRINQVSTRRFRPIRAFPRSFTTAPSNTNYPSSTHPRVFPLLFLSILCFSPIFPAKPHMCPETLSQTTHAVLRSRSLATFPQHMPKTMPINTHFEKSRIIGFAQPAPHNPLNCPLIPHSSIHAQRKHAFRCNSLPPFTRHPSIPHKQPLINPRAALNRPGFNHSHPAPASQPAHSNCPQIPPQPSNSMPARATTNRQPNRHSQAASIGSLLAPQCASSLPIIPQNPHRSRLHLLSPLLSLNL
jgi:hypothetical protein